MSHNRSSLKKAISEDDVETLVKLIPVSNAPCPSLASEDYLIDSKLDENILHFAVHHNAQKCVKMLIEPPYNWSPDHPNSQSLTPIQLALSNLNVPIAFIMATHSRLSFKESCEVVLPPRMLLYPESFNPLTSQNEIAFDLLNLKIQSGRIDHLSLVLELLIAEEDSLTGKKLRCYLQRIDVGPPNLVDMVVDFDKVMKLYALNHDKLDRLPGMLREAFHENRDFAMTHADIDRLLASNMKPMKLLGICRVAIRKIAVSFLRSDATVKGKRLNYATWIQHLDISHILQLYLSYHDLWSPVNQIISRIDDGFLPVEANNLLALEPCCLM